MQIQQKGSLPRIKPVIAWLVMPLLNIVFLPAQDVRIQEQITVTRAVVDVRVTNAKGEPIEGLTAKDFKVTSGPRPVEVLDCLWVDTTQSREVDFDPYLDEAPPAESDALDAVFEAADDPFWQDPQEGAKLQAEGRLIVMFLQTDLGGDRNYGLLKMTKQAHRIVANLEPHDYVAVLSFHAHLMLHLDFTQSHDLVEQAILDGLYKRQPDFIEPGRFPSLASHLDLKEARDTAAADRALLLIARALRKFGGPKSLLFMGWGLGELFGGKVHFSNEYKLAVNAFTESRTAVFTLDTSQADFHDLEVGLKKVSRETGGFYFRMFREGERVFNKLANTMRGHYVLTLAIPEARLGKACRIRLPGRNAIILVPKPYYN